jgi:hypothetical protein
MSSEIKRPFIPGFKIPAIGPLLTFKFAFIINLAELGDYDLKNINVICSATHKRYDLFIP